MVWIAATIAIACMLASGYRVRLALAPTALDPRRLLKELRGDAGASRLAAIREAVRRAPEAEWERELFDAMGHPPEARTALVNEQLTEFDLRLQRWARVPRACASIATSCAFLLAALALRAGFSDPEALGEETRAATVRATVTAAADIATIGIAGTIFCVAAHIHARKAARDRLEAVDRLVERLEALSTAGS